MVEQLSIPKRRIYDVVNILEGAGLMKRSALSRNKYRWNLPVTPQGDYETAPHRDVLYIKKLKEEERRLDQWIKTTTEQVEKVESYITSQHLASLVDEDSTALAIATPRKSILHLPHDLEQQHETSGHHIFTLIPPNTHDPQRCMLPKVFLLESGESMRSIPLEPPPPLLEKSCSDLSALNLFLHVWDDASEDAQSILRSLARSQDVLIKPEEKKRNNNEKRPFEMIKDDNIKVTEAFAPMNHSLSWDTHAMNHARLWESSHQKPHNDAIKKAPQDDDSTIQRHHPWEVAERELPLSTLLQMVEQLPMPTLLERVSSASLVLCEGA